MMISDHWLEDVERREAADHGGVIVPEAIVVHYTAGGSAAGSAEWLSRDDDVYVSAHVVIGRDGRVTQLLPFNVRAFHAGRSCWGHRKDLNHWSVGIEFANYGQLVREDTRYFRRLGHKEIPVERVEYMEHRNRPGTRYGWERFEQVQIASGLAVMEALLAAYPRIGLILGHDDVAPGRKLDPGPAFPMEMLRCLAFRTRMKESDHELES